jgi:hypothetical protein
VLAGQFAMNWVWINRVKNKLVISNTIKSNPAQERIPAL